MDGDCLAQWYGAVSFVLESSLNRRAPDSNVLDVDRLIATGDVYSLLMESQLLGRSVSACQKAFEHLLSRSSTGYPISYRPVEPPEPKASPPKPKKRPFRSGPSGPGGDGVMAVDRIIQPRITEFSSVNEPYSSPHPPPPPVVAGEPPRKKRGRPSKAEHELRLAEYAARGEPYPAPRKTKTPRQSVEGYAPTAVMFTAGGPEIAEGPPVATPTTMEVGEAGINSPGKRRAQPAGVETGARNVAHEVGASGADSTQHAHEYVARSETNTPADRSARTTLPEARPGELGYQGNLIAQMQEHATRVEPDPRRGMETSQSRHTPEHRVWEAYQPPTTT